MAQNARGRFSLVRHQTLTVSLWFLAAKFQMILNFSLFRSWDLTSSSSCPRFTIGQLVFVQDLKCFALSSRMFYFRANLPVHGKLTSIHSLHALQVNFWTLLLHLCSEETADLIYWKGFWRFEQQTLLTTLLVSPFPCSVIEHRVGSF